jgi:conjugal transfer pilus assembly protein TraW
MVCSKPIAALALLMASSLSSGEAVLNSEDQAIKAMSDEIRANAKNIEIPQNKHQHAADAAAREILTELTSRHSDISGIPDKKPKIISHTLIFASFSLGEDGLLDLLQTASEINDAVVIFRGITDEKDFAGSIMRIQKLAARQSPIARTVIDPTLFEKYGVSVVPTIVELDQADRSEIARVSGMSSNRWIREKISVGRTGDLGVRGDVEEILERNLVDVMKEKVAAIDWGKKKEESIERFWTKQEFIELPVARKNAVKEIDPTVVLTADLKDPSGKVLVPAGTRINPLEQSAFTQAVIVFDATDSKQIAAVDREFKTISLQYPKVTLISTQFSSDEGWAFYKKITKRYSKPVYKLTPEITHRFEINKVPSVVTAKGNKFVVREIAIQEDK